MTSSRFQSTDTFAFGKFDRQMVSRKLDLVDGAATILRATEATFRIRMEGLLVIEGDFFARMNVAEREEQHVAVHRPHERIRLAAMVDVMRAVAAVTPVHAEAAIDVTNAKKAPLARALPGFQIRDSLSGVFGDLPSAFEMNRSEAAFAVD